MAITASLPRIEEHQVSVIFDCPHCQARHVRGTAYDLRETIRISSRVPPWGWSSHWVRCSNCRTELHADRQAAKMQGASPVTVTQSVRSYLSFPKRVLAVAGLVLSWSPLVGVLLGLIAVAVNRTTVGWPKPMSIVALVLATLFNVMLFALTFKYGSGWSALPSMP